MKSLLGDSRPGLGGEGRLISVSLQSAGRRLFRTAWDSLADSGENA